MKIAFCFTGHVRTAQYAVDNILRFAGKLLPNIDFFIHTWDEDVQTDSSYNVYEVLDTIDKKYKFKSLMVENYKSAQQSCLVSQLTVHEWCKVNYLKTIAEKTYKFKYDLVVKVSPDIIFSKEIILSQMLDDNNFNTNQILNINDMVYISSSETMDKVILNSTENLEKFNDWLSKSDISLVNNKTDLVSIYRPECIPINSLNFDDCVNKCKDWY